VTWHRSLYWRIAIGFVLALAAMLVVQGMLLVWVLSRSGPRQPGDPRRFAQTMAIDLGEALETDPRLDVAAYVREQYSADAYPYFVMLRDGRIVANTEGPFPDPLLASARSVLQGPEPGLDAPFRPGRFGRGGPIDARRGPLPPRPVVANGEIVAVVAVLPRAPFGFLLERYAPTLLLAAVGSLAAGAALAAVLIFSPARRRLREVEAAAARLGAGDLKARVPEGGGDEIAAVASAFNRMADDLSARAAALSDADRARRQLLADVSHELTTPVTAMRGYLETLSMTDFAVDEPTRSRYLRIIADETARLEQIIGDLLDLARLEGGGGGLHLEDVPVGDLFARVITRHEREAAGANVVLTAAVEPGTPPARGDRGRLEQALQNLAANALRYAPPGSTIELRARPLEGGLGITVTDQGPGIPAAHLPRVFDRFYKVESSRRATPPNQSAASSGSGLGLSIVKAIVERHGGRITVQSVPGRTVFEVTLPALPPGG
jgi:signal transduction histidine kinase